MSLSYHKKDNWGPYEGPTHLIKSKTIFGFPIPLRIISANYGPIRKIQKLAYSREQALYPKMGTP